MDVPALLDRNGLLAAWRRLNARAEFGQPDVYELDERGELVTSLRPSARRQIVLTDIYCHIIERIGYFAAMSVPVTTATFGIRVPDVVWMPCDGWEGFDRDDPVPFVPDLCVEVLLDSDRARGIDRRIKSYLDSGAIEVVVVRACGQIEFWGAGGRRQISTFGLEPHLDAMYFDEPGVLPVRSSRP